MQYSLEDIQKLHKKYAPSQEVYDLVYQHCQIVCEIAEQLVATSNVTVDVELVRVGAMLHDIGVYNLFTPEGTLIEGAAYITHGLEGEKILKAEGFPEVLWRFASHHTGVGISKEQVQRRNLPLPIADYLADTNEELLIMYADKFHSKSTPPTFNSFDWYGEYVKQFGDGGAEVFDSMAAKFGKPDVSQLSATYGFAIR